MFDGEWRETGKYQGYRRRPERGLMPSTLEGESGRIWPAARGNSMKRAWTLAVIGTLLLAATAAAAEKKGERWALLVGVNDYNLLNDLEYCASDMQSLRDQLVANGFAREHIVL